MFLLVHCEQYSVSLNAKTSRVDRTGDIRDKDRGWHVRYCKLKYVALVCMGEFLLLLCMVFSRFCSTFISVIFLQCKVIERGIYINVYRFGKFPERSVQLENAVSALRLYCRCTCAISTPER